MFSAIVAKEASDAVLTPFKVMADATALFPSLTDFFKSVIFLSNVYPCIASSAKPLSVVIRLFTTFALDNLLSTSFLISAISPFRLPVFPVYGTKSSIVALRFVVSIGLNV